MVLSPPALRQGRPGLAQLVQHLAAQGVEGGQGQGQPLLHPDGELLTGEGGAAGAAELPLHLLPGQGDVHCRLGHGALHPGHPPLGVLRRHLGGLSRPDHGVQMDRLLPVFSALIGGPGLGVQLHGGLLLLAGAEHLRPLPVQKIPLGKALAGEGGLQLGHFLRRGLPLLPQGPGVYAGDDGHILRPLHPPLDLQTGHAHLLQLPQMAGQRHILQGQGVLVRPAAPAVLHPAGLGTQAPVAAAPPDEGGQVALPGVAHTQGPVDKGLDLNGGVGADIFDLVPAQLPGQHRPGHAQVGAGPDPVQAVDGHLGGGVEGQVWTGPPE